MNSQKGIGLVEVLVALLLLAIAVLGFSAMQMTAIKATSESMMRNRAMDVIKTLSESMRSMPNSNTVFKTTLNNKFTAVTIADTDNPTNKFCESVVQDENVQECLNASTSKKCTQDQTVAFTVNNMVKASCAKDISLNMITCPNTTGVNERQCIIAAWGDTKAQIGSDIRDCADASGIYKSGASCLIMETY